MGYENNQLYKTDFSNKMNLVRTGLILQTIFMSLQILAVFLNLIGISLFIYFSVFGIVFYFVYFALAIASIVLFASGFYKLSNYFPFDMQNKTRISATLLISFIAFYEIKD